MQALTLSKSQARKIILQAAALSQKAPFGTGVDAVERLIEHIGFLQLDTNSVVERAHHHVLASRIPDYQTAYLTDLCEDLAVFEYFFSDSGYMPMADLRYTLPVKQSFESNQKTLSLQISRTMKEVLDRIEREGPLSVTDFENDRQEASTGWWDWRPAKLALEKLYLNGELMINRTKTFKKIYDLPINLIPSDIDTSLPNPEEFARYIIHRTLGALGIAGLKEMLWRARRVKGNLVKTELTKMIDAGEVINVNIEGLKIKPQYILANQHTAVTLTNELFILSPFDILTVFRQRLKDFFDFDYQLECFVPAPLRKYGYFSLPVLFGDTFIARMDTKADRKKRSLIVHNIHFEAVELNNEAIEKYIRALKDFTHFNQCNDIIFERTNQPEYLKRIKKGF